MLHLTRRSILALILLGFLGGVAGRADAGSMSLSVDLNGVVIFTATSTAPDQAVSASLAAVNSVLSAHGSAYQFTSLSASSNYTGAGTGFLETTGTFNTSGTGTTADVLSVDTSQSGFLSPVGAGLLLESSASGSYSQVSGSGSYASDFQGANSPTLVFPFSGSNSFSGDTGGIPIGTVPSGYSLSNHFLFSITKSSGSSVSFDGKATIYNPAIIPSVPEPSSLALCGIAGLIGLAVARVRRDRAMPR